VMRASATRCVMSSTHVNQSISWCGCCWCRDCKSSLQYSKCFNFTAFTL